MRQLIQSYRTGEMKVEDVPTPAALPGGVLVRTHCSLVSAGTEKQIVDLARKPLLSKARARPDLVRKVIETARKQGVVNTLRKVQTRLDTPIPLGYSSAGAVVEVGAGAGDLRVGDRVACAGAGYANHADYAFVPKNLAVRIPDGVADEAAAFATVGAIALQGVRQADPTLGERVGVLGLGLIGQLTVQLLRANGCRVLGFDPNPARAKLAEECGAHVAVSDSLEGAAETFSDGHGLDAVIVAASAPGPEPLRQAGTIARLRGRITVVGLVGMEIERSLYYRKELDLRMSMSYGPGRYDPSYEEHGIDYPLPYVRWTEGRNLLAFLELVADGRLRTEPLVTHRFSIDDALDAYALISSGSEPYLGVLLDYGAEHDADTPPVRRVALAGDAGRAAHPAPGDRVRIGLVGAGSFGQSVLLPAIRATGLAEPVAIASAGGMSARRIGEQYGFRVATTDAADVVESDEVDAVFVLTRHHLHAPLTVRALNAGKHVFTEKPLALHEGELAELSAARESSPGEVMVGFNRRFAPLSRALAEHFAGRNSPLAMHYRVNAGFIPDDHWQHDPIEGGGRILGEVCHFVDLLVHLAGAAPVRVSAEGIAPSGRFRRDDNLSITIGFADGSVGSILYTAMGDSRLSKEYLEVHGDGRSARLEDFRKLECFANGSVRRKRSASQDKGFAEEMRLTLESMRDGTPPPIGWDDLVATTRVTFAVLEALRTGEAQSLR